MSEISATETVMHNKKELLLGYNNTSMVDQGGSGQCVQRSSRGLCFAVLLSNWGTPKDQTL